MKKLITTIALLFLQPTLVFANQPKNWQLGFQDAASQTMRDIVWFHDYMLMPIIVAISAFVLFLQKDTRKFKFKKIKYKTGIINNPQTVKK